MEDHDRKKALDKVVGADDGTAEDVFQEHIAGRHYSHREEREHRQHELQVCDPDDQSHRVPGGKTARCRKSVRQAGYLVYSAKNAPAGFALFSSASTESRRNGSSFRRITSS